MYLLIISCCAAGSRGITPGLTFQSKGGDGGAGTPTILRPGMKEWAGGERGGKGRGGGRRGRGRENLPAERLQVSLLF